MFTVILFGLFLEKKECQQLEKLAESRTIYGLCDHVTVGSSLDQTHV